MNKTLAVTFLCGIVGIIWLNATYVSPQEAKLQDGRARLEQRLQELDGQDIRERQRFCKAYRLLSTRPMHTSVTSIDAWCNSYRSKYEHSNLRKVARYVAARN